MEFLAPGFSLAQPLLLWAFTGSESVDRRFIYENRSGSPTGWQSPKHVYSARTILVLRATNQGLHNIISVQVSLSFCSMIHSMNLSNSEQLSFCYQTALELYSRQKERKTLGKIGSAPSSWTSLCSDCDFLLCLFESSCVPTLTSNYTSLDPAVPYRQVKFLPDCITQSSTQGRSELCTEMRIAIG